MVTYEMVVIELNGGLKRANGIHEIMSYLTKDCSMINELGSLEAVAQGRIDYRLISTNMEIRSDYEFNRMLKMTLNVDNYVKLDESNICNNTIYVHNTITVGNCRTKVAIYVKRIDRMLALKLAKYYDYTICEI